MKPRIKACIDNLKHLPGVYLMYDKNDTIIYVGKAKDLYKRVSQYFLRSQEGKVFRMVLEAEYFQTIITANEKEALVLEMNLIQKHYPKFNILLKDGSHYPYIAIKKDTYPYLVIKRNKKDKNYFYFGPFPNSTKAYLMIDLLNKIYPLRKCKNIPSTPCLYYHLGTCLAPCVNEINNDKYFHFIEEIKSFLKGNNQEKRNELKRLMIAASEKEEYEKALEYKKLIDAIEHINTKQNVEMNDRKSRDIFSFIEKNGYISLAVLTYKEGILLGKEVFVNEVFSMIEENVADMILQYYQKHELPDEIILNNNLVVDFLKDLLDVEILSISKGRLYDLLVTATENAQNYLEEYFLSYRKDEDKILLLEELGALLGIPTPLHIELFDNSHLQGSSPVGAMVVFINGEKAKNMYRKFKIEHEEARDDLSSMKEVLFRHYKRRKEENAKMPDLILLDGGIAQITIAKEILISLELDIPIFGLYKNDKHKTEGLIELSGNTFKIENKLLFFLLTRMQDEVHRFAISFHKEKRSKAMKVSLLDDIKGLGEKRKENLLRIYKDIHELKNASLEELSQFLPREVAKALFEKLHLSS